MTRLFFRGAIFIQVAMTLTIALIFLVFHLEAVSKMEQAPPDFARFTRVFTQETTAHLSEQELSALVERMQKENDIPVDLMPLDDESIAPDVREGMSRGEPIVRIEKRRIGKKNYEKGVVVFVPVENGKRVIAIGPQFPMMPEWHAWIIASLLITVIVSATAIILFRPLVKQLRDLEKTVQRVAQGDLETRTDVRSRDAVGSLATTFNEMMARIQTLLENQQHLVQAVSHELRTPISRIRFGLEMMDRAENSETAARRREAIEADLAELDHLVEELLVYSRYDSGRARLLPVPVEPLLAVQEQVSRLSVLYPELQISVVSLLKNSQLLALDNASLERVLRNLMHNAARYAKSRIEVRLRMLDNRLMVEVHDDGPGIPEEDRKRVLEPFVRLDDSRTRSSGGVGLGLAIVDRIMHANGGDLGVEESDLSGATIIASWPIANGTIEE